MRTRLKSALVSAAAALLVTTTAGYAAASVSTDRYIYYAGETVQISGDEMWPGELVTVEVTYPDGSLAQVHEVVADADGLFSDTYTLPMDAPGGIYGLTATGVESGNVFATTFDPPTPDPTTTTLNLSLSSITYGDDVSLSGRVSITGEGGVSNAPVSLTVSGVDCSAAGVALGTATGSTGNAAAAGYWTWPVGGEDWKPSAGTWYVKAFYAGRGDGNALAASSDCETLVVAKAPTATSITKASATSFGLGSTLSVDYLVKSARGVDGNTTGGAVSVSQVAGPSTGALCGTPPSGTATLTATQSDADGSGADDAGFSATGTLQCTPSQVGSYTYRVEYTGDSNYLGSNSANEGLEVTELTLQVCKAAPAIAVEYMQSRNVKPGSKKWRDVVTTIAGETGSQGEFHAKNACAAGYADAVRTRVGVLLG